LASRWPSLVLDELLAVPRPLPQRRHLRVRDEAGPQRPVLVQLSDPLAVGQVFSELRNPDLKVRMSSQLRVRTGHSRPG
jgi:hypothetical protein